MGLWSKIKGWLNIGGVKVKLTKVETPFKEADPVMKGRFVIDSKTEATILSINVEFFAEVTSGDGEERETEKTALGGLNHDMFMKDITYPFDMAAGESKEVSYYIDGIDIPGSIERDPDKGVLGAAHKVAKFVGATEGTEVEFFVEASVDVKGTPFDPSDRAEVQVVLGEG